MSVTLQLCMYVCHCVTHNSVCNNVIVLTHNHSLKGVMTQTRGYIAPHCYEILLLSVLPTIIGQPSMPATGVAEACIDL